MGKWEMVTCQMWACLREEIPPLAPVKHLVEELQQTSRLFSVLYLCEALTTGYNDPFLQICHNEGCFLSLSAGKWFVLRLSDALRVTLHDNCAVSFVIYIVNIQCNSAVNVNVQHLCSYCRCCCKNDTFR